MRKLLICHARGREDGWQAVCLDFDLMVEGTSFEDVQQRLNEQVHTYFEDASREAEPARSQLLERRSPLHVRLAWWNPYVLAAFFRGRRDKDGPVPFPVSCPA